MTITVKPVKQRRNVNTKQINQRIPPYLYLLRIHRSNDEPASQRFKNKSAKTLEMKKYAVKGNHGDDHRRTTCAHEQQTTPTYHDAKKMRRYRGNRPRPNEKTEIGEPHCETIPNSPSPQNFYSLRS